VKKIIVAALSALLVASLLPAASAGKAKPQVVEGSIILPAVFAQGQFDGCWGGATRRTTGAGTPNGVTGYLFDVDPATWGGKFKLEPTGGEGTVDLDIFLYLHMPASVEEQSEEPVAGGTPVSVDYTTREAGGETGTIPADTVKGIVCMYGGPEYQGFDASFTYTGTPPKKKKK
jgi:hypothetical protein